MNYKTESLAYLKDIQRVYNKVREVVESKKDYVYIDFDDEKKIVIKDLDFESDFHFIIHNPTFMNNKFMYKLTLKPYNAGPIETKTVSVASHNNGIFQTLTNWISLIEQYETLELHPNSKVFQHYEKEIFKSFTFIDDENDDLPLEREKQILLSEWIDEAIVILEEDEGDNTQIIEELKYLNANMPKLNQKQIKLKFGRTMAKVKFTSITLINKLAEISTSWGVGKLLDMFIH
ncbi:hypothetical protein [Gaetbulibacter saemankumensis]|uniref:hypothetical protein n=1 Tax=Gaetbulibacter saemankumensis TaxID=311208 RepID=UPI000404A9D2|nr:hypothetical protein [Gaetbulibacter saemankumensis]